MLDNVLIHFRGFTHHHKFNIFSQLPGHIKHNPVHLLESICQRNHSHGHDNILQICGNGSQLRCGLIEIIKVQARHLQIRALQYH